MKKIIIVLGLLWVVLCFSGCDKPASANDVTSSQSDSGDDKPVKTGVRYAERVFGYTLSEAGVFKVEGDKIYIYTLDENEEMILCYDPNCNHIGGIGAGGDPRCMAWVGDYYESQVGYYEGALYLFERDGYGKHKLYKMETNGAGRELMAELPYNAYLHLTTTFCEDKLYYPVRIVREDETTKRGEITYRMIEVNLLDGSYRFITEESKNTLDMFEVTEEYFIVRQYNTSGDGKPYFVKADLNTLEETVFISKDERAAGYSYIDLYDEDSYFYWDSVASEIGIRSIVDGTIEMVLLKGQENERFHADVSDKWIMYHRDYEYEGEKPGWYFMSIETGEIIDITEVQEKYNLEKYDGYYDVFLGQELDGNNRILNPTLYSREKIINEAKSQ